MRPFPVSRAVGVLAALVLAAPAKAAESYDNCTGTIASLPATISTQGTWCLKTNLSTAIGSGAAVTIAANNVTVDCNDFKIGGLAAGSSTETVGILAVDRLNTTVRGCGVRGFRTGIRLQGGSSDGGLIEDNRLDGITVNGIDVEGAGHVVRRNRIVDSGGRPGFTATSAIVVYADTSSIVDNVVAGVTVGHAAGSVVGIGGYGNALEIARNYVSGLTPNVDGSAFGINAGSSGASSLRDNHLLSEVDVNGFGIVASGGDVCIGNVVMKFSSGYLGCIDGGGNISD